MVYERIKEECDSMSKKYLIRGGKLPFEQLAISDYLKKNLMGSNCGNFLYLQSVIRALLLDEDVTFESTRYRLSFSDKDVARYNEECAAFIIPLADAFRPNFMKELRSLTKLIKRLTIPCYVIGVGVSQNLDETLRRDGVCGYEDDIKNFVNAVLEKSSCLGLRGNSTGEFLSRLGYKEHEHFRVIGCPSMYTFGSHIKIADTTITKDSPIAINLGSVQGNAMVDFICHTASLFPNASFIPQRSIELKSLYLGMDFGLPRKGMINYPHSLSHPLYRNSKFFVNVHEWFHFLRQQDLVFGSRLHGNVAGILSGRPSIMLTKDMRMRELAAFHGVCHFDEEELPKYKDVWEMLACCDFHSPERVHKANFANYLSFLQQNGIPSIYDSDPDREDAPFDALLEKANPSNLFAHALDCDRAELFARYQEWETYLQSQTKKEQSAKKKALASVEPLQASYRQLEEELGRCNDELRSQTLTLQMKNQELQHTQAVLKSKPIKLAVQLRNATLPQDKKFKL